MNRGSGVGQHAMMVEHKQCQLEPIGYADLIEDSPAARSLRPVP
jgi:hypothetical protein